MLTGSKKEFCKTFYGTFHLIRQLLVLVLVVPPPKGKPSEAKPLITFGCQRQIELTCVKVQRIDFLIGPKADNHKGKMRGPLKTHFAMGAEN